MKQPLKVAPRDCKNLYTSTVTVKCNVIFHERKRIVTETYDNMEEKRCLFGSKSRFDSRISRTFEDSWAVLSNDDDKGIKMPETNMPLITALKINEA